MGSSSVIAMVCSEWAPREPSALRRVQPSASVTILSVVSRNQGSIAITSPGSQREAAPGPAVVRHVRIAVHGAADAVAAEVGVDRVALRVRDRGDRRGDVADLVARMRGGDRCVESAPGRVDEAQVVVREASRPRG